MKHFRLGILLLLAAAMLSVCFSCAGEPEISADESSAIESGDESEIPGNTDSLVETDIFNGHTIRILTAAVNDSYMTEIGDNEGHPLCPEALRKAIVDRTDAVCEAYGVEIEEEVMIDAKRYNGTFLSRVRNLVTSNICEFDIIYPCLLDAATMASEGILVDLSGQDGISITNSWWSQPFIQDTSVLGTYYLTGDIGLRAKNACSFIYFNKNLFDKYNLDYPYDTVRAGDWTYSELVRLIKAADMTQDLDGDLKITYHDNYGLGGQYGNMSAFFYAAGERIAQVGPDGLPYLSFYNERSSKVLEDYQALMQSEDCVRGDDYFNESITPMTMLFDAFKTDHCLFYMGNTEDALRIGDMESDFGILPLPKYDRTVDSYYSVAGAWSSNAYAIPFGIEDDRIYQAAVILDALGSYSVDTVAKAYYDVVLQYQKLRSEDDVEMLSMIFSRVGSDLGSVFSVGGISGLMSNLCTQEPGTLRSSYEEIESKAKADIETIIQNFTTKK